MSEANDLIEEDAREGRKMDKELRAIGAMLRLLDELPDVAAKGRVVGYLASRFYDGAAK